MTLIDKAVCAVFVGAVALSAAHSYDRTKQRAEAAAFYATPYGRCYTDFVASARNFAEQEAERYGGHFTTDGPADGGPIGDSAATWCANQKQAAASPRQE